MTTFNGHGRNAVRNASSSIATKAQNNLPRNGRNSGSNGAAHCWSFISFGVSFAIFSRASNTNSLHFRNANFSLLGHLSVAEARERPAPSRALPTDRDRFQSLS